MAVNIGKSSRLRFGQLMSVDDVEFWEVLDLPAIPENIDDFEYVVTDSDRIDLLAYRFYGDSVLWWVIAVANDLELLPTDLVVGAKLRIPSPSYVKRDLFIGATQ